MACRTRCRSRRGGAASCSSAVRGGSHGHRGDRPRRRDRSQDVVQGRSPRPACGTSRRLSGQRLVRTPRLEPSRRNRRTRTAIGVGRSDCAGLGHRQPSGPRRQWLLTYPCTPARDRRPRPGCREDRRHTMVDPRAGVTAPSRRRRPAGMGPARPGLARNGETRRTSAGGR